MRKLSRRQFMASGIAAAGLAAAWRYVPPMLAATPVPGSIVGASSAFGHRLRQGGFAAPARTHKTGIIVVGGGIAGLSAAYALQRAGYHDFQLLELEAAPGGNSSSGRNDVSAYPWGAHYVPLLSEESTVPRRLFEDFGIITGHDSSGLPIYDEFFLCADPHERLYMRGRWQEGLVPVTGVGADTEAQYQRFFAQMAQHKNLRGRDGKKVFAIPVDASSQDADWLALDRITMRDWMQQQEFTAEELHWYVDYCCRDDYGTPHAETSAWAGLHYFASRTGRAANAPPGSVVTWPQGNGWLAQKLAAPLHEQIRTNTLVHRVRITTEGVEVDYLDHKRNETLRVAARAAILAVPRFVAMRLLQSDRVRLDDAGFSYAPWAVANVTLDAMPEDDHGMPLCWDNVVYRSPLLGYVTATQQFAQMHPARTVLTYYWPLSHLPPDAARKEALARGYPEWQRAFLSELLALHPDLDGRIRNLDVWLWGHAMVRPTPGFIWGAQRKQALQQHPPVFLAHSDMSGMSIFEEASTHGVHAAEQALQWI